MECRGLGPCHPHCLTKSLTQQGAERTLHHKCPPLEPTKPPCPPSQRASPHLGGHPPISEGIPPHLRGCPPISEGVPSSQRASPHLRGHPPISEGIPASQRASPISEGVPPHLRGHGEEEADCPSHPPCTYKHKCSLPPHTLQWKPSKVPSNPVPSPSSEQIGSFPCSPQFPQPCWTQVGLVVEKEEFEFHEKS